ncbi:hypothetical protein ASPZODRAFT_154473 [Penicilliopsis zonata CBS 506.65]|uniref:Protein HRI1 n=1 Tax=Penicilliopsis zonata CBS 506.65 TaxID=1073090 RepID=A0A1L9S902_9EURO|nr:hypothetical protein ASPZODRAFT_154473 [Penicilliopsis zonata CBS 506.65]OJJ43636.1 hypothetical protein ASPZODRAFT_154473 [Penicilliopsis zonata CBS 506.65]
MTQSRQSTRVSLRWPPEPAFESTDTLVLSVKYWYVDVRVDKESGRLDWGIAGQRLVESKEPSKVLFTHEIDSHNAFDAVDCGTFVQLPNGDDLETGEMPRPDLPGAPVRAYEEVWRALSFRTGPEGSPGGISWVLESEENEEAEAVTVAIKKTFLARIWGSYLAVQQELTVRRWREGGEWKKTVVTGGEVSARREEWEGTQWTPVYVVGEQGETLPSLGRSVNDGLQVPGNEAVVVEGQRFLVRAFETADC